MATTVFNTNKRIRLGMWGLGRGMDYFKLLNDLNFDVVAGCDFNEHMRKRFLQCAPGAFVTADARELLSRDFDAVLLATFCPAHAADAIACMEAGKHVLSEVTSFHTMAEGVRLVEAVERTGKIYQLAENYPYQPANRYLAKRWREGLFGELMYGEYEYVHEVRTLLFTYIDGVPIVPGDRLHNWRSWIHFHYYNTHSLGPMMIITGRRPTRVTALPSRTRLEGYLMKGEEGMGGVAASLINMEGGAVVRNLMGATTNDTHYQRLWGTRGSAEIRHEGLFLRLGASGGGPKLLVEPQQEPLDEWAKSSGHGGGDFYVPYYFARQILTGEPGPFDVYTASDCTIPGILAYRSGRENGRAYDVPNFRNKSERDAWRGDDWGQPHPDISQSVFPARGDRDLAIQFNATMTNLVRHAVRYRSFIDWAKVIGDVREKNKVIALGDELLKQFPAMQESVRTALKMVEVFPGSTGAGIVQEVLGLADNDVVLRPGFQAELQDRLAAIKTRYATAG